MGLDAPVRLPRCWCGNAALVEFSETYGACAECGTLVSRRGLASDEAQVHDDERDFYGKQYWLTRQRDELGFPDIYERARLDLPERCIHWLRTLLTYRLPPGRILELGSGHGAFVALMRATGFDATGLELSPWVVDFAHSTFGVPVLLGPIEAQALPDHSLDVIVLNDVLEHLVEPRETLRRCARLLGPDGFLLVQTPCYPEEQPYRRLVETNHPFLAMLQEREHLYLFSPRAARQLLVDVGLPIVRLEPALFPYDMVVLASRRELIPIDAQRRDEALLASPSTRLVVAMVDLSRHVDEIESDRADRVAMIGRLNRHIEDLSRDSEARGQVIEQIESDRADRVAMIGRLNRHIEDLSRDYEARGQVIEQIESDRAQRIAMIERLNDHIKRLSRDYEARGQVIQDQQATIEKLMQQRNSLVDLEARLNKDDS
jgi:2-polyprenyl-3-methyl-5-hydroxy-6-metoxy-1,4-benzoquinol methylase